MIDFFINGGIAMWPILILSIIAIAIIIERFSALILSYKYHMNFFSDVIRQIKSGKLKMAAAMCYRTGHPLANVIIDILKNYNKDKETIESAASIAMEKIIPKLQKRTNYLQMISNVSTLVGLLGTIQGLIVAFDSLKMADPSSKAELLASGISTAMNTTAFGLIVAIPCLIAYNLLTNKENSIIQNYERTANEIIHILAHDLKVKKEVNQSEEDVLEVG